MTSDIFVISDSRHICHWMHLSYLTVRVSVTPDSRHVCHTRQQTCLSHLTADSSVMSDSRHICHTSQCMCLPIAVPHASLSPVTSRDCCSSSMGTMRLSFDMRLYLVTNVVNRRQSAVSFCQRKHITMKHMSTSQLETV